MDVQALCELVILQRMKIIIIRLVEVHGTAGGCLHNLGMDKIQLVTKSRLSYLCTVDQRWVLPLLMTASLEAFSYPWKDSANQKCCWLGQNETEKHPKGKS